MRNENVIASQRFAIHTAGPFELEFRLQALSLPTSLNRGALDCPFTIFTAKRLCPPAQHCRVSGYVGYVPAPKSTSKRLWPHTGLLTRPCTGKIVGL